jgi:hypothetical protein
MDRLLRGEADAWARLEVRGVQVIVQVDSVLAEARLHAGALRQLLAQLRLGEVKTPAAAPKQSKGSKVDELSRLRARRGATTSDPGGTSRL